MDDRISSAIKPAVIGAGWAGLSAAASLAQRGIAVSVFEASRRLGGRARRVDVDNLALDNGQHILIGAYAETLALMRAIDADPERLLLRVPLNMRYADGFHLRAPRLPFPLNLAAAMLFARGLPFTGSIAAMRFMRALEKAAFRVVPDRSVEALLREHGQEGRLRSHLWEPLCVSALNTPIARASAQVFANVLRDGLTGRRENSDLLLPRTDLGRLLPEPAADFVRQRGGEVRTGAAIRSIRQDGSGFRLDDGGERYSHVIVAVGAQHACALLGDLPGLGAARAVIDALEFEPIVTCYLQYPEDIALPAPMLGFTGGIVQWVFDRGQLGGPGGLLAAVISASGAHQELAKDELAARVHAELDAALRAAHNPSLRAAHNSSLRAAHKPALGSLPAYRTCQVITERRATFSCTPGLVRPAFDTPLTGLLLAGDYVASDYPGTLESAVRSGLAAARACR